MKRFFLLVWATLFFAVSCGFASDLTIASFSPQGEVEAKPVVSVVFNSAVVDNNMVGRIVAPEEMPINIRPEVSGYGVWESQENFVFNLDKPLKPATRYVAEVSKGFRASGGQLVAGKQNFEFYTKPLEVVALRQVELSPSRQMTFELQFSQPVSPIRLRGFLTAASNGSSVNANPMGTVDSTRVRVRTGYVPGDSLTVNVASGLKSDVGDMGLARDFSGTIMIFNELTVQDIYTDMDSFSKGALNVQLSRNVDIGKVKSYVQLEPAVNFNVTSYYSGFRIEGDFEPRSRVTVTLKKGLGSDNGSGLVRDYEKSIVFPDRPANVRFPSDGIFLSPFEQPRIALEIVNMQEIDVSSWKLYANNIPVILSGLRNAYSFERWAQDLGTRKFRVDSPLNQTGRRALDLSGLFASADVEPSGVFLIEAKNGNGEEWWNSARTVVTVTDMALSARVFENGAQVWVTSISEAKPVAGAKVSLFSESNQLLGTGSSNSDGVCMIDMPKGWSKALSPAVAVVEGNEDVSFLLLDRNNLDAKVETSQGRAWIKGYDGLWVMPRNLFRQGETVEAKAIVRADNLVLPGQIPLTWKFSGRGLTVGSGALKLDEQGARVVSVTVPDSAMSGNYTLDLLVPGQDTPIASQAVVIEDFQPPQLELDISKVDETVPGEEVKLNFGADYLFGAPGAELRWELSYRTNPLSFKSDRYPNYSFGTRMEDGAGIYSDSLGEGALDDNGKASVDFTVPSDWKAPSMMAVNLILKVMEPDGRWVEKSSTIPCYPWKVQVGVLAPVNARPGLKAEIPVVALNSDDSGASVDKLDVAINKVSSRYVMVRESNRNRMVWQEEVEEVGKDVVNLSGGNGKYDFTPDGEGQYELVFSCDGGKASVRFYVYEPWRGSVSTSASAPDQIEMTLDKKSYKVGEVAKLSMKAPFDGLLMVTVGTDKLMSSQLVSTVDKSAEMSVTVTREMFPNAWCVAQVVRPLSAGSTPPYRAVGAVSFSLDSSSEHLRVIVKAPARIEPLSKLAVEVEVKDSVGNPVNGRLSLALVDRGIIGLTGWASKDPWQYFTDPRRLSVRMYDVFDDLLPVESRETPLLHPAGGAAAEALRMMKNDSMSPVRPAAFKPMSVFVGEVEFTDGKAVVEVDIPEFAGRVRAEVVALAGSQMGRGELDVEIARVINSVVELPRALAPGDRFSVPVQFVSDSSAKSKSFKVEITPFGTVGLVDVNKAVLDLELGDSFRASTNVELVALEGSGDGGITLKLTSDGEEYSLKRTTTVRPPFPRVVTIEGGRADSGEVALSVKDAWFTGTGKSVISVSGAPVVQLETLADRVRIYGSWASGLVADGWKRLAFGDVKNQNDLEAVDDLMGKLMTLQVYDGSFVPWAGSNNPDAWSSMSIIHLMTSLKQKGYPVDEDVLQRSYSWLRRYMADSSVASLTDDALVGALNARAYGCYILAVSGQAPYAWMNWLDERVGDLGPTGRALLGAAWAVVGSKDKAAGLIGGGSVSTVRRDEIMQESFRLLAMIANDPGGFEARNLAEAINNSVASNSSYISAQGAGSALMALGSYVEATGATKSKAVLSDAQGASVLVMEGKTVTSDALKAGDYTLSVSSGPVWYTLTSSGVPVEPVKPFANGMKLEKRFVDKDNKAVDVKAIAFGQEVFLELKVVPGAANVGMMISVLSPGGLEAQGVGQTALEKSAGNVQVEKLFDRTLLHVTDLTGTLTWKIPYRAVTVGEFVWPPVSVEAPGRDDVGFLDSSSVVVVK